MCHEKLTGDSSSWNSFTGDLASYLACYMESHYKKHKGNVSHSGGNTESYFGQWYYEDVWSRLWSSTHKKQLRIFIEYAYILMLRLHQGNFVNVKWVKIPSLAALQVAKYLRTVAFKG